MIVALAVVGVAYATTYIFWNGDIAPSTNKQTSSHQFRYGHGVDWTPDSGCAKEWYRNNGSTVNYDVLSSCNGHLLTGNNTSPSTATTWAYCRNTGTFAINATCYTCVNNDIGCG
jgi:hypothetical protein